MTEFSNIRLLVKASGIAVLVGISGCGLIADFDPPDLSGFPPANTRSDSGTSVVDASSGMETDCEAGELICGLECVDTTSNPNHCGGCNRVCSVMNATADCESGSCIIDTCNPGYTDANDDDSDGCEEEVGATPPIVTTHMLAVGTNHSCAIRSTGRLQCWGANGSGQLGDGSTTDSSVPVDVSSISDVISVANGNGHTCAVIRSGHIYCWGSNTYGQLGDGTSERRLEPTEVVGISNAVSVATGATEHSCALLNDGTVQCWGSNMFGELGDGSREAHPTPGAVSGLSNVIAIACGSEHTCALKSSGQIYCWGRNVYGTLGDGTEITREIPVAVRDIGATSDTEAVTIAASSRHTCAVLADASVRCWGFNRFGQVGPAATILCGREDMPCATTPLGVTGVSDGAIDVATGRSHTCVRLRDGTVECWGFNTFGQVGYGSSDRCLSDGELYACRRNPAPIIGISDATELSIGTTGDHLCVRRTTGGILCWGRNTLGQLGSSVTNLSSEPTAVVGFP